MASKIGLRLHDRKIGLRLHDTSIGISQDDANDATFRSEIFGPMIRMLRAKGWKIGSDPDVVKHYNCLRHDRRLMRRGNLRGSIQITGRCISVELWAETWAASNRNGHRYDFDKRERLDYLDRLRVTLLERQIIGWLGKRASISVTRAGRHARLTAMERIAKDYAEGWHTDKELGRPRFTNGNHDRRSADGALLEHGQTVWVPDRKGRIVRAQAFYNLNSMWWVVLAPYQLRNISSREIYARQPDDLRRKRNDEARRKALEAGIAAAVLASDFRRAELLTRIAFGGAPAWRIWSRKADAFYGPQYCGYTSDANRAGRYTREEAEREVRRVPHILHAISPQGRREDFATCAEVTA